MSVEVSIPGQHVQQHQQVQHLQQQQQQQQLPPQLHLLQQHDGQVCQVCHELLHKYRCPGCHTRTCSLDCSRQHKQSSGCTGKRDKFKFVPMAQLTDREFLSDYRWLEEVARVDDAARRSRPPAPRRELPPHLSSLVHQAKLRGVRLLIMSPGMQRRQTNSTRYEFRARKMFWRVEWSFPSASAPEGSPAASGMAAAATGLTAVDGRVDEDTVLCDVLQRHLDFKTGAGSQAVRLQQYRQAGCQGLTVLMKKERCPANAVRYYRLDIAGSLKSQLAGKTVIEFPTLTVLLPGEESSFHVLTPEEQQADQQALLSYKAGFRNQHHHQQQQQQHQQRHIQPPPPPPPPPPAFRAAPATGQQQQQQQQPRQQHDAEVEEPPSKRPCVAVDVSSAVADGPAPASAASPTAEGAVGGDALLLSLSSVQPTEQQQQQQQQQEGAKEERMALMAVEAGEPPVARQETCYYYDPADGADDDAADFLAGLEDEDDVGHEQQQQQQSHGQQTKAAGSPAAAAGLAAAADGDGDSSAPPNDAGKAAMLQLLGHYDENEIDISDD